VTAARPTTRSGSSSRIAVTAAYAAQGLGYAAIVTSLPHFKARYEIDDDTVSLITLTVVLMAAAGSWLADLIAIRWGSRAALVGALALEAVALVSVAFPLPLPVAWVAFALYGLALGTVDASQAMQAVILQRRAGTAIMGSFYAAWTAATIVAALAMSGGALTSLGVALALGLASALAIATAVYGIGAFDGSRERDADSHGAARPPLPRAGIWVFGLVILAAFTLDSTVSTWSSVYLGDNLGASDAVAPLGYALYSGFMLAARLVADALVRRWGRARLALVTAVVAAAGAATVALLPAPAGAMAGFALAGAGVGALAPLAFSAAGDLDPRRGDEIVARVNIFNYAGALVGAVVPGLLSGAIGLRWAFLIAAVAVACVAVASRRFATRPVSVPRNEPDAVAV